MLSWGFIIQNVDISAGESDSVVANVSSANDHGDETVGEGAVKVLGDVVVADLLLRGEVEPDVGGETLK